MNYILSFIFSAITLLALDSAWFYYSVPTIYTRNFSRVIGKPWSIEPSLNVIIATVVTYFALLALLFLTAVTNFGEPVVSASAAAFRGATTGCLSFAIYNGTCAAVFGPEKWGWDMFLADCLWGAVIGGSVSYVASITLSGKIEF
ncbi:DUF2177 domain-containing protein [Tetraselmis virus 1]|uniref:DUF2177 domain-containing protein n=1 Tax=Tetraselmis virus 1 TaxID=2060617 RepID=A0A2P0VN56_9VIRU|nr:DUF2177 domain-containing protein [Tetraselmis virus 1]AUF82331.1 DUF2177 domain-containing protein [Tetraselmis virus 1]